MSYKVKIESTKALKPQYDDVKGQWISEVKATVVFNCPLAEAAAIDGKEVWIVEDMEKPTNTMQEIADKQDKILDLNLALSKVVKELAEKEE